jgi:hypothetical protein
MIINRYELSLKNLKRFLTLDTILDINNIHIIKLMYFINIFLAFKFYVSLTGKKPMQP